MNRADALLCAAKMILHSHRLAVKYEALASTGIIKSSPGSTNTVPGWVQFSLDIRASRDDVLLDMEEHLKSDFDKIAKGDYVNGLNDDLGVFGRPCTTEWTLDAPSRAIRFDSSCINSVRQSADDVLGHRSKDLVQDMISGAGTSMLKPSLQHLGDLVNSSTGHDSVFTSRRSPTSMIFVPCLDGVSHNPREYCAPQDCANGAQVLVNSVLRYDRSRQLTSNE